MNVKTALDRAKKLQPGQKAAAADLYADIDYELALGDTEEGSPDYEQGENALAYLEEHFPGVRDHGHDRVENGRIPQLSRKASAEVWSGSTTQPEKAGDAPSAGDKPKDTVPATGASPRHPRPRRVPAPTRQRVAGRRASYQAARTPRFASQAKSVAVSVDQATGSWGSDAWDWALGGVGLCFLFLLISGKGPQGFTRLFTGASNVLSWVIDPTIDPLRPTAGATK